MDENKQSSPPESKKEHSYLTTPLAIIVAGGLIAVAIYFSNTTGTDTATTSLKPDDEFALGDDVNPQIAGQQAGVGDFRPVSEQDHIRGAKNAKVTIIEYSDFECPFCKRFHTTMQQVIDEYPDDVRWVYRQFPLAQLHSKAEKESIASECAGEQGRFWELADIIFEVTPSNDGLDLNDLPKLAKQAGVSNIAQFESCLDNDKYADHVQADIDDAVAAGGQGTPYSVAVGPDGQAIPINGAQPFEQVSATIDSLL